jgi:hypothetical protein
VHAHFEGTLTARNCKRYIPHQFSVAPNSRQVHIHLRFAPYRVQGINNLITLTVFDPEGFRGAGHRGGDSHDVRMSTREATPGYIPGPLPAGAWTAEIDTHMIMPGEPVRYQLDITVTGDTGSTRPAPPPPKTDPTGTPRRGPGWYRGDLHTHSNHSDAGKTTVADLVEAARAYGLDFVFLTDHNTTSGLAEMDAAAGDDLLTAGGIELTTFWGHALVLGTSRWIDWRVRPGTGEMARIATAAYANDQVFIISHPLSSGEPRCTGCTWRYGDMMPGSAEVVEIWNGPWHGDSNNELALALWYDWLNQGLRLAATAGTDVHSLHNPGVTPGFSVIYAENLSEAALLTALRAGHLYLSAGPQVSLQARSESGERWLMGDSVAQPADFSFSWANALAPAQMRLIVDGRLLEQRSVAEHGEYRWSMRPDQAHWVLVEMRDNKGEMLAITNPIYMESHALEEGLTNQ